MKSLSLSDFKSSSVKILLTDIDGTITDNGRLPTISYQRIEQLTRAGIAVIPVTGRPAGWCELIARLWPVHGVIGENGAFYFRFDGKKMKRHFVRGKEHRAEDRKRLRLIWTEIRKSVPKARIASDQFCRLFDLAVDFAEDMKPLPKEDIQQIVKIFKDHGATAKVSNIHVNGWYGDHDKVSTCQTYLKTEFGLSPAQMKSSCAFSGDSPNDEPMFGFFPNSFAVSNIEEFWSDLKHKPTYVAPSPEATGFCEIADRLLVLNSR